MVRPIRSHITSWLCCPPCIGCQERKRLSDGDSGLCFLGSELETGDARWRVGLRRRKNDGKMTVPRPSSTCSSFLPIQLNPFKSEAYSVLGFLTTACCNTTHHWNISATLYGFTSWGSRYYPTPRNDGLRESQLRSIASNLDAGSTMPRSLEKRVVSVVS